MLVLGLGLKPGGMLAKALVTFYLMAFLMGGLMEAAPVKNARAASVSGCGSRGLHGT